MFLTFSYLTPEPHLAMIVTIAQSFTHAITSYRFNMCSAASTFSYLNTQLATYYALVTVANLHVLSTGKRHHQVTS